MHRTGNLGPFGIIFVGRLWDEARLLKLAYAFTCDDGERAAVGAHWRSL
jgi:Asp-tRNA(Asn)/Glu-tRNA(Gln) amidotransferase A subunit family amidase